MPTYNVYEYGYRTGMEHSKEYIEKQLRNPNFFKGLHETWIKGYCDAVLNRDDLPRDIKKLVEEKCKSLGVI